MPLESPAATTENENPAPQGDESSAPGAESAPAVPDPDEGREPRESGVSKRIDELTRNWRETERERDYLRQLLLQQQAPQQPPQREAPREEPDEPELKTLADFNYDERAYGKYMLAEATRVAKREAETVRKEFRDSNAQVDREIAQADFEERVQAFAKAEKIEDFDLIFKSPAEGGPTITPTMGEVIQSAENGAQIAYYLAKNRAESARIARMPPAMQQFQLGMIAATKLSKPTAPSVSGAPPPAPRIDGSSSGSSVSVKADSPDSDKLSDAEWARARDRQLAGRRLARNRS